MCGVVIVTQLGILVKVSDYGRMLAAVVSTLLLLWLWICISGLIMQIPDYIAP